MHEFRNKEVQLENKFSDSFSPGLAFFYLSGSKLPRKIINIKLAPVSNYFQLKEQA